MVPRDKSDYLSDVFYYDFSFQKQNMKRFVMLLVFLAVSGEFISLEKWGKRRAENEGNVLPQELRVFQMSYHVHSVNITTFIFHIWSNFQLMFDSRVKSRGEIRNQVWEGLYVSPNLKERMNQLNRGWGFKNHIWVYIFPFRSPRSSYLQTLMWLCIL